MSHYSKYGKKSYEKHKHKYLARSKELYLENKDKKRDYYYLKRREAVLKSRYGITLEDYETMLQEQGGSCAICKSLEPGDKNLNFHVDHCHATNKVRGLLCNTCNLGLGYFHDSVEDLTNAIEYLKKYSGGMCGL